MDFSDADIPPDTTPTNPIAGQQDSITSSDPACEVCGQPLFYSGRGRRPKLCDEHKRSGANAAKGSGRGTGNVGAALTTLGNLYDLITMGLTIASPPAASVWVARIEGLQASNAKALQQDRKLVDSINRIGQSSARGGFFAAHVVAVAPVIIVLRAELAQRLPRDNGFDGVPDDASSLTNPPAAQRNPPRDPPGQSFPNAGFFG